MAPPTVSILLPMWNEERYIARCLDSLLAQEFDGRLEIVIADGASSDRSVEIVRRYMAKTDAIVLVDNPRRNTAIGRNLCLEASSGEIVVSFIAHAVAPPDFLDILVRKLQQAPAEVAAVGAGNVGSPEESLSGRAIAAVNASLMGGGLGDAFAHYPRDQEVRSVALTAYRAGVVKRLGGYDGTLWVGEDFELNHRIRQAGFKILFTPETVVTRFNRSSLPRYWRQMFRYGVARSLILRKHPDSFRLLYLVPGLFAVYVVIGLAAGVLEPRLLPFYGAPLAFYAACGWCFALLVSRDPLPVALSPIYFFAMHFSYGLGLFRGAFSRRVW